MRSIALPTYARKIRGLLTDLEQWELEEFLDRDPEAGALIPGGHGIRKVRWAPKGRGKRGGLRVIYYWKKDDYILFLTAYPKGVKDDLSAKELKMLAQILEA